MRDDLTTNRHITAHLGGVAPQRHELARRQYVEKLRARQEGERHAATIGRATQALAECWRRLRVALAPAHSIGTPALRRNSLPAE